MPHASTVSLPVKCEVMKRKDEPKRVKEMPTAPLVLMMVTGLVANVAEVVAKRDCNISFIAKYTNF